MTVAPRIKQAVEQDDNKDEGDRHDDGKASLGLLQPFELPGPFDAITGRQLDVGCDALLRLFHRAGQIAAAHAELDRHETLITLAENIGRARVERYRGEFAQRNIAIDAARRLIADLDIAHVVNVIAIFLGKPHDNAELPVGFQKCRRRGAAQCRLNDVIDVAHIQP